jgi:chaperonin GroES
MEQLAPDKVQTEFDSVIDEVMEGKVWIQPDDDLDEEFHEKEKKTPGGIVLPDNYEDKDNRTRVGVVRGTGSGWYDLQGGFHKTNLKPGDRVLFMKYKGQFATVDGHKYIVVHHSEVLARLRPAARPTIG